MGTREAVRCVGCGRDVPRRFLGLAADGHFDAANAQPNELSVRTDHYGGRGRITVTRDAAPLHLALGIREMLKARLAQVDAELRAAGVELED
jgi:hypothetical protein